MQTVTYEVLVHKAGLALQAGESVGQYTSKLRGAVAEHVMKKLNLTQKTASVYMVEAYGDACVVDVYMRAPTPDSPSTYKYYAVKYTRKDNGAFDFAETTQVMPVTTYQPVDTLGVTKSVEGAEVIEDEADAEKAKLSTASANDLPDAAFAIILPGGKKDAGGKTAPRELRMLPHHTSAVKSPTENTTVDLPHLRNALARVNQIKIPQNPHGNAGQISIAEYRARAKAHLMAHAKELLPSDANAKETKKSVLPCWVEADTEKSLWTGVV